MSPHVLVGSPPENRGQPLLINERKCVPPRERRRVGEMAGGTTAECAAICCCFPCTVMNLLVLAVYKLPAGLCKKVLNKTRTRKRQRMINNKKGKTLLSPRCPGGSDRCILPTPEEDLLSSEMKKEKGEDGESETVVLEKEMWARFAGAGFWRSESQRQP